MAKHADNKISHLVKAGFALCVRRQHGLGSIQMTLLCHDLSRGVSTQV